MCLSLQPFSPLAAGLRLELSGRLHRAAGRLAACWEVRGILDGLAVPAPAAVPTRRHRLWEETCFELFLAVPGAAGYWELNLSPAGDWNLYRFDAYREGMREEGAVTSLPLQVSREPRSLRVALDLDLEGIAPGVPPLEAGMSAVLRLRGGELSYWALIHPGSRPDFHRRDGFIVKL